MAPLAVAFEETNIDEGCAKKPSTDDGDDDDEDDDDDDDYDDASSIFMLFVCFSRN